MKCSRFFSAKFWTICFFGPQPVAPPCQILLSLDFDSTRTPSCKTRRMSEHSSARAKFLPVAQKKTNSAAFRFRSEPEKKSYALDGILGSKKSYCRWSDFAKNHFGELAKRSENSGRGQERHILRALETRKKGEHIWREMDTAILKTGQGLGNWFPDFGFTIFGPVIFLYLFKIHSVSSVTFVSREAVSEQKIGPTPPT